MKKFFHRSKTKKNISIAEYPSSLPSAPLPRKSDEDESSDDDRFASSDGAMCSASSRSKKGTIYIVIAASIDGVFV
jgi:hypothetical protein